MPPVETENALYLLIKQAVAEDVGTGDVTTASTIPAHAVTSAQFVARQEGVVAGLDIVSLTFEQIDPNLRVEAFINEGAPVQVGTVFAEVRGATRSILTGERTALNFLRHLSGVATLTNQFVQAVADTNAKIIDTRKTTPGMRHLEKSAVRAGGGDNHRIGLYDMVLIKDNHIVAAGGITAAVERCRQYMATQDLQLKIEVETESFEQVREAVGLAVDRIMLDNMSPGHMQEAVKLVRELTTMHSYIEIEASGAITLDQVRAVAETGVDFISIGALTHSAPALDISLNIA